MNDLMQERKAEMRGCRSRKMYSVYHAKTDEPLILYANSKECAKAMGITKNSFHRCVMRMRQGKIKMRKWAVYEDEVGDLEDGERI